MVDDPRVRKLSFTGSTEVGRSLLQLAARTVVNTSMELGGNAPFLVFADADLDAAVDGAMIAKMRNVGEACTAANRFYAEEPVAGEFGRMLSARMEALKIGPGLEEGVQVGPLINEAARPRSIRCSPMPSHAGPGCSRVGIDRSAAGSITALRWLRG